MRMQPFSQDIDDHIGAQFKAARLQKGLSVKDVSELTNLRADYIANIEALNIKALPSIGYVLGYVRSYAKALNMDADKAVADYKSDVELPKNLGMPSGPHIVPKFKLELPRGFVLAIAILFTAISLGGWYGLKGQNPPSVSYTAQKDVEFKQEAQIQLSADKVTLTARAPSWVEIKNAKGDVLHSQILVSGQSWQGPIGKNYFVSVRDAGAIEFYYGDIKLGPLGAMGEPAQDMALQSLIKLESLIQSDNLDMAQAPSLQ